MALNSKIILCKNIDIDKDYNNVLSYTEQQMLDLCNSNTHKIAERNNYSFIRPTNSIFVDFTYAQCLQANYIAFQNTDYSGKWFFAWIDEVIYKSDNNCELKYTIDAWSTWFDYWNKKSCYVVREHVNDDTIGLHTIPEDLHVEDYIEEFEQEDVSLSEYFFVGVLTSHDPIDNDSFSAPITIANKNIFSKKICYFENVETDTSLGLFLLATNTQNHTDDIDSIFFIPAGLIDRTKLQQRVGSHYGQTYRFYEMANDTDIKEISQTVAKLHSFSGLNVKNNKCFCYPYNYLFVSNNIGNHNIYKYENFSGANATFKIQATTSIGCSGRLLPLNYKGMNEADDEVIPLAKYPTIAWSSDTFTNWLTEQAINIPTQIASAFIPRTWNKQRRKNNS